MVKEVVSYINIEGKPVTQTCYFNLTRAEISEITISIPGGWEGLQERLDSDFKGNFSEYYELVKLFVTKAYGVKSKDGLSLIKPEQETLKFVASEAYSTIIDKLFSDETGGAIQNFMNKVAEGARSNSPKGNLSVVKGEKDNVVADVDA
jgi:hypothetical protein